MIKKLKEVAKINEKTISSKSNLSTIYYIDIASVENGFVTDEREIKFSEAPTRARRIIRNNDILLSTVRPNLRHYVYIQNVKENTIASTGFAVISCKTINPRFLYYFLTSNNVTNYLSIIAESHTSTYPSFPPEILEELDVPYPSRNTQDKIADILGALDDKIELNRQMNQTLESMARAIFKSWFVDFEPVYAKMEGRDYPLPPEIMDLFPNELEESELGLIPKGWKISTLEKIADYLNGLALQKYPPENDKDKLPVIKIRELRSGSPDDQSNFATSNLPDEYVINDGDILFSWSGSLLVRMWCGGKGALNQHLFKVTSKKYPKWFYYLWTEHHLKEFQRIAADKATTMGHIKRHHLQDAKVIIPNSKLIELGTQYVYSIIEKILLNSKIENLLIQKRELLLPKLISGEIEV